MNFLPSNDPDNNNIIVKDGEKLIIVNIKTKKFETIATVSKPSEY